MNPHAPRAIALNTLTASEALALLGEDQITARDLVAACLTRIDSRNGEVKAWLAVNPDALAEAERLDALPKDQRGALHGLPIAVKDVFETRDLPTTHNSPLFAGFRAAADAPCVDLLRAEGAIILGKTDTTEFAAAGRDAQTANPHDLSRTPGGSSAGSAAAVADFQTPLALATQTGGSTIRPASFCGVYGFKPTFGLVNREGAKIYANSLDTVGWHARSVDDIALMAAVYGICERLAPANDRATLRIAVTSGPYQAQLDPEAIHALAVVTARLRVAGHDVQDLQLAPEFVALDAHQRTILHREGAAAFRNLARRHGADLHDDFHHRMENRDGRSLGELRDAYDAAALARIRFDEIASDYDVVIAPSAPGIAPVGRKPGNPVFNAMWTLIGAPCLNVPVTMTDLVMPVGVTLIAPRFGDVALLDAAQRIAPLVDLK